MFWSNFFCDFFQFQLESDYWRKIVAFFVATSHYNATNSLNATTNHTASHSQLFFACEPFLDTKKVSFLQLIERDETFKGICLDHIAQRSSKWQKRTPNATRFGLHVKHNESSKYLIYTSLRLLLLPRSPKQRDAPIVYVRLRVKGLMV